MRPVPRRISAAEQAETDRVAEETLREIKRVLALPRRVLAQPPPVHSEACDCAGCVGAGP
mgnify:FL=1